MLRAKMMRRATVGFMAVALIGLSACSPVPKVLDTPKNGEIVKLAVNQPMQVRWSNMQPSQGAWVLEKGPSTPALVLKGQAARPPVDGAAAGVEVFDFMAAAAGTDSLTFVYKRRDGQPPSPDERITLDLTVG